MGSALSAASRRKNMRRFKERRLIKFLERKDYYIPLIALVFLSTFSGCEQPSNTRIPETPELPAVIPGDRQLTVSWNAVPAASAYEVWIGTGVTIAMAELYRDSYVTETTVTITGLDNYNTYYVWIRALNNAGKSGFSPQARGVPGV
jgi:hypothetical protein